jgi:hypothetical protein
VWLKVVLLEKVKIGDKPLIEIIKLYLEKMKRKRPFICRHTEKMHLQIVGDLLTSANGYWRPFGQRYRVVETFQEKPNKNGGPSSPVSPYLFIG